MTEKVPKSDLEELVERWREKAPDREDSESRRTAKLIANQCADELQAVLEE